ncbi:AAA family ATPase [Alistipes sp. An116]|uniref:nucleoside kinase n=1 Tax=Alistipes sp. An116 TaxID=1965546 RepID=UPI000B37BA28|nr:nucleoside kinase [Alistipes sp. An116]OUQ52813.1 AAA family ATPase [Alistipes sp. An116]
MNDTIQIICENLGGKLSVEMGTPLRQIAGRITPGPHPFLAAFVNNRIKELSYRVYTPVTVRFVDITSFAGIRVYQRTAWFLLQKAVKDLYPGRRLHIRHSMGQSGFYCEIEGIDRFSQSETDRLCDRMRTLVEQDLPIERRRMLTSEVRARYAEEGFADKIELLDTRPRLYSDLYTLDDTAGYFYGSLAPSTGYLDLFDLEPCYNGFYLALPLRTDPDRLNKNVQQEKMFSIFQEYQSWVTLMGVPTIGAVNARTLAGDAGGMIKMAEAFHERKFADVADAIQRANAERGIRMVLISGPSSSGKTTSAKRLGIQLGVLGLRPVMISLDDYFVDREKTPLDENGEYDYEALEAIDLELFNDHLRRLMAGQSVDIPRYDFITGRRTQHGTPLTLDERSILIIEGIHGLNPRLTPSIPDSKKFRIYISCFTSVAMDNLSRIATTDNRLLRRLTRDYKQRGADALHTLSRWASVRRGEERHIFPYQENADVMLNSSLFYEISVLRPYAEKILREVPDTVPEFDEARRMLKFLDNFIPIPSDEVPPTSILREFIGGSSFTY